jgi:hypothetical protein
MTYNDTDGVNGTNPQSATITLGADTDSDGEADSTDNCVFVSNGAQTDTDSDGIGDACDGGVVGASYVSGDDGTDPGAGDYIAGVNRTDGGDDYHNRDSGDAKVNLEYEYSFVFVDDSGETPNVEPQLYLAHRVTPTEGWDTGDFFIYDLTCSGASWAAGKTCAMTLMLGPAAANKFFFKGTKTDGTVIRIPESGYLDGPTIAQVGGFGIVSAARDISSGSLDGGGAFGSGRTYKWVSTGLDAVFNVTFNGYWDYVTNASPVAAGTSYFIMSSKPTLLDLTAYTDNTDATFSVTLSPGWNLIGNPYNGDVLLSDVQVKRGSDSPVTWTTATSNSWVFNTLYYYTGVDWGGTYISEAAGGSPDATLRPWLGYWIYLRVDDDTYTLIFSKPKQTP